MRQPGPLYIGGLAVLGVALLLGVIGLGTNSWNSVTNGVNWGLWKLCGKSACVEFTSVSSWMEAVRAFTILGFLVGCAALLLALVRLFVESLDTKLFGLVAAGLALGAAFCFFLGTMIYAGKHKELSLGFSVADLSYSFALCIIAWILMIGAGILICLDVVRVAPAAMAKA